MSRLLTLLSLFLPLHFLSYAQEMKYDNTIDIITAKDSMVNHNAHDLSVINEDGSYKIEYFVKHGKNIQPHRSTVNVHKFFNKASYTWKSENKVALRLFDTDSQNELKVNLWGKKKSTVMELAYEDSDNHEVLYLNPNNLKYVVENSNPTGKKLNKLKD